MKILNYTLLFCCLLSFVACEKHDFDVKNLNNNNISIIGHGGMGISSNYPMNSYESILQSLYYGAQGCEIDLQLSADGALVAFHDKFLEESTNLNGQIYEKNWSLIDDCHFNKFPYSTYKVQTLNEIFDYLPNIHQYQFFLDIKNYNPDTSDAYNLSVCMSIIKIIDAYNIKNTCFIELKSEPIIKMLREIRPDIKIYVYSDFDLAFNRAKKYKLNGIVMSVDKINAQQVKSVHAAGLQVVVFNAHSESRNLDAIKMNVDFIQTDKLQNLVKLLKDQ